MKFPRKAQYAIGVATGLILIGVYAYTTRPYCKTAEDGFAAYELRYHHELSNQAKAYLANIECSKDYQAMLGPKH
jgi:hypothetical protein